MKRDWDLIRKQLTDIEEENDLFSDIPAEPALGEQGVDIYEKQLKKQKAIEDIIYGHFELLINNGYIGGMSMSRTSCGFAYGLDSPRLTMDGHDLLDTMRSTSVWERTKTIAKTKGVELTFDAIKALSALALKSALGNQP